MIEQRLNAFVDALRLEHRDLHERLHRLCEIVGNHHPSTETAEEVTAIIEELTNLEKMLQRHFATEENGGYLEEALVHAPHFTRQASRLARQHAAMLSQLRQVIAEARQARDGNQDWDRVCCDVQRFTKSLAAHEAAENRIIEQAFNIEPEMLD